MIILASVVLIWMSLLQTDFFTDLFAPLSPNITYFEPSGTAFLYILHLILGWASLVYALFLFALFRKTTSPEIVFLIISVLSFIVLTIRYPFILPDGAAVIGYPIPFEVVHRIYYFFYLYSILIFFLGGFFSNGIPILKQNSFIFISIFVAASVSILLPQETGSVIQLRPPVLSYAGIFYTSIHLLEAGAVINYLSAALRNNNTQYLLLAFSLIVLFLGLELFLLIINPIVMILGFLLFAAGLGVFTKEIYTIHLWS